MSELKKEATREGYGRALVELGKQNKDVVVLDADLNDSTRSDYFRVEFPQRFFNAGIAEQNMIGMAAGLSVAGKIPYASTFAIFSERAIEFTRNIVARNKLNVKIAGSHAGLHTGEDGKSAQAIEDIALYRALPHMLVLQPCDAVETRKAVFALAGYHGPSYMRLLRNPLPIIHDDTYNFEIGKGEVLQDGNDVAIFATGTMVHEALAAFDLLKKSNISATIINMHTIKPSDGMLIGKLSKRTGCFVTAEDHNIHGGLGSAVAEYTAQHCPTPIEMVGMQDRFGESGKPAELYKKYGLDAQHIAEAAKKATKRK
jgi:transketolase